MTKIDFKIGDSVVVRPHVIDPGWKVNIGGWQGRICEINEKDNLIGIRWDSITLQQIPGDLIDQSTAEGMDWEIVFLHPEEVERTNPRDSESDVIQVFEYLEKQHNWSFLGEEGIRIQAVLAGVDEEDEFDAWYKHFQKVLQFPLDAVVYEWEEEWPLETDEKVKVLGLAGCDETYGVMVSIDHKRGKFVFPLADLEVIGKSSPYYQYVKDYVVYFANR